MIASDGREGLQREKLSCLSCGSARLLNVPGSEKIFGITSDCRPWSVPTILCVCECCGLLQKRIDYAWRNEVDHVYEGYTLYGQGSGSEQLVFSEKSGIGSGRSPQLVSALRSSQTLSEKGRLLDVGCGNGSWLQAWSEVFPKWTLVGFDLTEKYRTAIKQIKNVEDHYTGGVDHVPGSFDLISMIHTLEHLLEPAAFLSLLRSKLNPGGMLFIQVPDHQSNPFDLLIVDHSMHFSRQSLTKLLSASGWIAHGMSEQPIQKEISVIARDSPRGERLGSLAEKEFLSLWTAATSGVNWLNRLIEDGRRIFSWEDLGLFGTSIAATWLCSLLGERVRYFVDEDPHRVGRTHMNRPILSPAQLKSGQNVLVCLTPTMSRSIIERLSRPGVTYHCLPN